MALIRLIDWSRVTKDRDPELSKIIEAAIRNNPSHHITGYLAFDRNRFAQVLEGAPGPVSSLFHRIASDPRHRDVTLVEVKAVEERSFEAWDDIQAA
ncbi:MAG: BLUF domain-containing protein [Deltaproteobacteria bacterium]|nr:BLUF domain-containing protein [Deltaproteobacteria bacterium]